MGLRFAVFSRRPNPAFLAVLAVLALLAPASSFAFSNVVVDPGHGGWDRGGIPGQKVSEKAMALDVGLRLEQILKKMGLGVRMTRDDDTFIPLDERAAISNRTPDAIFVSIHFDAYYDRDATGVTTIFYNGGSRDFAADVQRELVRALHPNDNRSIQRHPLRVLHINRWPAILVEGGYLTNPGEAAKILDPAYRQKIAQAIADGIARYGGSSLAASIAGGGEGSH